MQVKKFEAPTMQEALKVIKRELGPEAIILSTKHIKGGFGLMSKASVEVTAAISEKDLKKKQLAERDLPQEVKEKIWDSKAEKQSKIYNDYFEKQLKRSAGDRVEISAAKERAMNQAQAQAQVQKQVRTLQNAPHSSDAPRPAAARERRYIDIDDEESAVSVPRRNTAAATATLTATSASATAGDKVKNLERDIEQLRGMVSELSSTTAPQASSGFSREESDGEMTDELMRATHDLVAAGLEKKLARQLIRQVSFELSSIERHEEKSIVDRLAFQLVNEIKVADLLENVGARSGRAESTVLALVGPTGVGKTTTIAKIASLAILERRLRVGLINLDSYKVAAADQLSTYAKIMNVPFRSVNTKEELQQAIYDFSSLDLVLIDTTGRSQKDQESLLQLRHMLASVAGCQSALMISATTKDSDMNEVVARFRIFHPVGLVFSKLDETSVYGCIYNVQKRSGLPLLYFTVGQRVPEDIEKASAERVVDLVLDI